MPQTSPSPGCRAADGPDTSESAFEALRSELASIGRPELMIERIARKGLCPYGWSVGTKWIRNRYLVLE